MEFAGRVHGSRLIQSEYGEPVHSSFTSRVEGKKVISLQTFNTIIVLYQTFWLANFYHY